MLARGGPEVCGDDNGRGHVTPFGLLGGDHCPALFVHVMASTSGNRTVRRSTAALSTSDPTHVDLAHTDARNDRAQKVLYAYFPSVACCNSAARKASASANVVASA